MFFIYNSAGNGVVGDGVLLGLRVDVAVGAGVFVAVEVGNQVGVIDWGLNGVRVGLIVDVRFKL
ncbi:MAG: hypothetical protein PVG32_02375 [Anaerolineales bacterium]